MARTGRPKGSNTLAIEDAASHARQARYVVEDLQKEIKQIRDLMSKQAELIANLQLTRREIAQLRRAVVKSTILISSLLDDPDARRHAEAVLKDTRILHFKRDDT